jgi:hypothetical protein
MLRPHWQYFLSLVDDMDRLSRYVELAADNFSTYSTDCTRILLAASSEVDVVAKVLCEREQPGCKVSSIIDYGSILLTRYPSLPTIEVSIPRVGLSLVPWDGWTANARPRWWQSYNAVKHERHNHAKEANLGNALTAVAALCVLVCYLDFDLVKSGLPTKRPFFFVDRKYNKGGSVLFSSHIELPDA